MAANDGIFRRYTVASALFLAGEKGAGRGYQLRAGDRFLWDGDVVKILPNGAIFTATTALAAAVTSGLVTADDGIRVETGAAASFALDNYDEVWVINRAAGAATAVTTPPNPVIGQTVTIKDGKGDAGANPITITTPGAELIDGSGTVLLNVNWAWMTAIWGGLEWHVIAAQ
jgi:hypothetical protein